MCAQTFSPQKQKWKQDVGVGGTGGVDMELRRFFCRPKWILSVKAREKETSVRKGEGRAGAALHSLTE